MSEDKHCKLSIITINYNNFSGLKRTVESVINQSWKEFEYIVIDGGSTDGSAEYLSEMIEHFAFWVSEPDKGIYNAMNKGIKVANGEYLLFLNSGDWLINNDLLNSICGLFEKGYSLIYGSIQWFDYYKAGLNNRWKPPSVLTIKDFYLNVPIPHQATFYKKSVLKENFKYNEKLRIVGDWDLTLRQFKASKYNYFVDLIVSVCEEPGASADLRINELEIKKHSLYFHTLFYIRFWFFFKLLYIKSGIIKKLREYNGHIRSYTNV
jgi:glycosyltransferase involved in cell wall biosynthesis